MIYSFIIFFVVSIILVCIEIFSDMFFNNLDSQWITIIILIIIGILIIAIWKLSNR